MGDVIRAECRNHVAFGSSAWGIAMEGLMIDASDLISIELVETFFGKRSGMRVLECPNLDRDRADQQHLLQCV